VSHLDIFIVWILIGGFAVLTITVNDEQHDRVITAIQDNGCSSHQELSQTKSNADVYNYAALSTSY